MLTNGFTVQDLRSPMQNHFFFKVSVIAVVRKREHGTRLVGAKAVANQVHFKRSLATARKDCLQPVTGDDDDDDDVVVVPVFPRRHVCPWLSCCVTLCPCSLARCYVAWQWHFFTIARKKTGRTRCFLPPKPDPHPHPSRGKARSWALAS